MIVVAATLLTACSSDTTLKPFSSDGCSLFPDSSLISRNDWCSCCFEHDLSYWRGGTRAERKVADQALRACVFAKTGDKALADVMYQGVRVGGSPYFYNWYRWGYGWSFDRKYQALTPGESRQADRLIREYLSSDKPPVCPNRESREDLG